MCTLGNQQGLARRKFLGPHSPPLPLRLVAKHMVQGKPRGGGSPRQNCLLQSHSRPCHWTSEGPIFMPVGGHCQLGGTFSLFYGSETSSNCCVKEGISPSIVATDSLTP